MSSYRNRVEFFALAKLSIPEDIWLVTSPTDLGLFGRCFSAIGNGKDLKTLYPMDSGRRVMEGNSAEVELFRNDFNLILNFLKTECSVDYKHLTSFVDQIIPITGTNKGGPPLRANGSGLTTHNYRGGVFISPAIRSHVSDLENVLNLVHELGHTCLNVYLSCDEIILDSDKLKPVYSVVRKCYRPALMSFHALVATAYMYDFILRNFRQLTSLVQSTRLNERMVHLSKDLEAGLLLCKGLRFSSVGLAILMEIEGLSSMARGSHKLVLV